MTGQPRGTRRIQTQHSRLIASKLTTIQIQRLKHLSQLLHRRVLFLIQSTTLAAASARGCSFSPNDERFALFLQFIKAD